MYHVNSYYTFWKEYCEYKFNNKCNLSFIIHQIIFYFIIDVEIYLRKLYEYFYTNFIDWGHRKWMDNLLNISLISHEKIIKYSYCDL